MTEYHTVKQIDNSRLARSSASGASARFLAAPGAGAALAACLLFYAWQHFECIQIRYQIEQLDSQRAQAVRAESATASGSCHAAVADARGCDCAKSAWLDGSCSGQVAPADGASDARGGARRERFAVRSRP